ncbi:tetraacyldisaccharide 4'-kinase [Azospirillum brasilense]|uniref:Tetraacyldisaccharide 4'-kinase n=1 Tax=Azospirillum brasilense TaxID=192 RepID=A0A0P0F916_AZOBR|nr:MULTISPECIES: tetraacyldisaccharide 4'-kinase [Azospirillum]ALJ35869.1 tetraacyldisaccharide 4'-kinase [Azospirillum brasilense]MDW7552272.1 tetraacyldisaccharide 4'-kinase [Azospirillum brasilense]MDW7593821.1 tetraacyldisaccharide 4'-kinase [Azospirillum brasilense]MDW7628768.1 tetraacyldisaccharide 4'-kinase [Azospirillum brasilense]MDX5954644.1 tetraacyldisaccharide 4'-kinase [Azospirillum brasilense]
MRTPGFWYGSGGAAGAALGWALAPLGALYGLAGRLRMAAGQPERAAAPVVCVGNLVAGGAGKTPVCIALAEALRARGIAPAFLTRGHGGREGGPLAVDLASHDSAAVGDEALLLAAHGPCWVARNRAAGARAAVAAGAAVLVMDDGFQNPGLAKDLSLIVVDGAVGFGNGHLIPAGPLREPVTRGLARAGAVVVLGEDRAGVECRVAGALPVLHARLEPAESARALAGQAVLAFAGIGRPEKFFATLEALGARVVERAAFADHHPYRPEEVMALVDRATALGAVPVTTVKDAVRLPEPLRALVRAVPVRAVWRDPAALDRLLAPLMTGLPTGVPNG